MPMKVSESNWNKRSTLWIAPPSICVFRCFPGLVTAAKTLRSRCTPCSICTAIYPPSSAWAPAKIHEIHMLDQLLVEPGSIYLVDRAYLDFQRLYALKQALAFFIIRARKDFCFQRVSSLAVDKSTGLRCDQIIRLKSFYTAKYYPEPLRRIRYHDAETDKNLVFLTNHFLLPSLTIAQLYKCRWQVELFFKWIKQHLRIKRFYGVSPNAVKTQIWIADVA